MTKQDYDDIDAPYIKNLTKYQLDTYYERASIMEFDGGLEPEEAAKRAYNEVKNLSR
jgi:hypothetical protein